MPRWRALLLTFFLLLAIAACSGDGGDPTTTTNTADPTSTTAAFGSTTATGTPGTSVATTGVTTGGTSSTTTSSDPASAIPEYQIEARLAGEAGDTVVVSLRPATYSDLDIENVVSDVVQRFAPITTLHVIDDAEVVELVLAEEATLTAEQVASRDAHYYARLEEGFRLVFEGPFSAFPQVILGS